ncbi:hypothetical protein [Enorma phocaeensis]|uniref:hypothetical protein n=1 Tax=Enorma phocaeensis TaxID=1871019 RepID=UPI001EF6121E|nr:hypothetical protein [Enorma phocaeensis]
MMNITNAATTTPRTMPSRMEARSPYETAPAVESHGRVVKAGMSLVEMVAWLAIMAVLSLGMIWLLWKTAH